MKRPAFARESIEELVISQKELIEFIQSGEELDSIEFAMKYNRATLGLLQGDFLIDVIVRYKKVSEYKEFLIRTLPQVLRFVLRKALRYRGELTKFRDIPAFEMGEVE